jgi:hypothetical protein
VPAVTALSMRPLNDETWRYTWTLSEPEVVASVEIAVAAGEEADFDDLFPAGTTSPLSPLDYGAPGGDGLFTFGVRPIDTAGNPGTPRIAHSYRGTIADALFARMSVQPNAVRKNEYRTLLARLDEASILTKLDALYLLGAHDEQAAYLNLVQAAYDLSETGTGTFTANRGWQGDGSTGYLDSGFNPATAGGLYAQDDAHMGVWVRTEQQSAAAAIGNTRAFIRPRNTSDQMATRGNQSAAADVTAMASSVGHSMWSRIDATQYRRYRDGVSAGLLSVASDTLSSLPLYIGGSNLTADEHYPGQIFAVHWGASLSSGEAAKLHEIILAYAVAVGAA